MKRREVLVRRKEQLAVFCDNCDLSEAHFDFATQPAPGKWIEVVNDLHEFGFQRTESYMRYGSHAREHRPLVQYDFCSWNCASQFFAALHVKQAMEWPKLEEK